MNVRRPDRHTVVVDNLDAWDGFLPDPTDADPVDAGPVDASSNVPDQRVPGGDLRQSQVVVDPADPGQVGQVGQDQEGQP